MSRFEEKQKADRIRKQQRTDKQKGRQMAQRVWENALEMQLIGFDVDTAFAKYKKTQN